MNLSELTSQQKIASAINAWSYANSAASALANGSAALKDEIIIEDLATRIGVTTFDGSGTIYEFIQPDESVLFTQDVLELDYLVELLSVGEPHSLATLSGFTFDIQSSVALEGPYNTIASFTAATIALLRLTSDPNSTLPMGRFVRYAIRSFAPWQSMYRIRAFAARGKLPKPLSDADSTKRSACLSPWRSYRGSSGTTIGQQTTGIQPAEEELLTDDFEYLVLEPEITHLSGATLLIETAFGDDGPWRVAAAYTQAYTAALLSLAQVPYTADVKLLGRRVRTRIVAVGGEWSGCYRVNAKWS